MCLAFKQLSQRASQHVVVQKDLRSIFKSVDQVQTKFIDLSWVRKFASFFSSRRGDVADVRWRFETISALYYNSTYTWKLGKQNILWLFVLDLSVCRQCLSGYVKPTIKLKYFWCKCRRWNWERLLRYWRFKVCCFRSLSERNSKLCRCLKGLVIADLTNIANSSNVCSWLNTNSVYRQIKQHR